MRALCGLRSVEKERPLSPSPKFHLQEGEGQLGLEGLAMGAAGILFGSCFAATTWSLPFVQNSSARTAQAHRRTGRQAHRQTDGLAAVGSDGPARDGPAVRRARVRAPAAEMHATTAHPVPSNRALHQLWLVAPP